MNIPFALLNEGGQDRYVSVRYGKNLISLEQEENFAKCYSGVVAFYKPDANYRFAPVNVPGKHPISRALPVDMSDSSWAVENYPDLVEKARKYILDNNVGQPEVSLTVKISSLRNSKDYGDVEQLEKISFGDTVHVYFPNLEITSSARVSKTVYDCLRARYDSIDIGSEKKNAADVIENQQRQINRLKN